MAPTISWKSIFDAEGVPYVEKGPNVARNNINIACPWCGDDPSHHLGVSLDGQGWGCWRDAEHRGKSPYRLLFKLIGDRALKYVPEPSQKELESDFPGLASRFSFHQASPEEEPLIEPWREWRKCIPITPDYKDPFFKYLSQRGLVYSTILKCGLRKVQHGPYKWRVLIPVYWGSAWRGFVGRAISPSAQVRYKASPGLNSIAQFRVYWPDKVDTRPQATIVTEGPFDGMTLAQTASIHRVNIAVVSALGIVLSPEKIQQIHQLPNPILAFDKEAEELAVRTALKHNWGVASPPPRGKKDLGECTRGEIYKWIQQQNWNSSTTAKTGPQP